MRCRLLVDPPNLEPVDWPLVALPPGLAGTLGDLPTSRFPFPGGSPSPAESLGSFCRPRKPKQGLFAGPVPARYNEGLRFFVHHVENPAMRMWDIAKVAFAKPFHPFRVHLADSSAYDVHDSAMVLVGKRKTTLRTWMSDDEEVAKTQELSLLNHQITSIQMLDR